MNKIIGLVTGWGSADWMEPSINQALEYSDEVIVGIGAWSDYMKEFEDDSYNICKKYDNKITLLEYEFDRSLPVNIAVATSLNFLLSYSKLFKKGNWIWLFDCDEFYHRSTYEIVKDVIEIEYINRVDFDTYFFLINMQYYLKGNYVRMWKIEDLSQRFIPTHHWPQEINSMTVGTMFHYSMLKNPYAMVKKWKNEYRDNTQDHKVKWANEIYKYYDIENEDYWNKKNIKVSGIEHPWFTDSMIADGTRLFRYPDKQPEFIEETQLVKIKDFRKYYNF